MDMSFHVSVFGCQMNVNEAEWLERALLALGLEKAPEERAQVLIVMTCGVRDKPEQKVYSLLGRWERHMRRNPRAFVAVGGCVAQQIGLGFFQRFPFVRLVFGTDGLPMAPQAVQRLLQEPGLRLSLLDFSQEPVERPLHVEHGPERQSRAFVSIMQGCDNFCAYCIVPHVRGRQKSRTPGAVLEECRELARRGVRELTLLGQNVNSYGLDKDAYGNSRAQGTYFAALLRQVAAIPGVDRLRFTTSHPKDIAREVVLAFGELENLCPHLHLPVQSGSDRMLRAMGRKYGVERYLGIVRNLRAARPDIALTTDLIVGFPGETEEDFQATLDIMREVGFASSFCFIYSDRPGVRSVDMQPKVEPEVKGRRLERMLQVQEELTRQDLKAAVGTRQTVLLEGASRNQTPDGRQSWRGHDAYGRTVNLVMPLGRENPGFGLEGKMITASILEAKKHSLFGEAIGEPW